MFLSLALLSALYQATCPGPGRTRGPSERLRANGVSWLSRPHRPHPLSGMSSLSGRGAVEHSMGTPKALDSPVSPACSPHTPSVFLPCPLSSEAGFLSQGAQRQPGAVSPWGAADSALFSAGPSMRRGEGGSPWLPPCGPGSVPWECCLGQSHIEGMASMDLTIFPAAIVLQSAPLVP